MIKKKKTIAYWSSKDIVLSCFNRDENKSELNKKKDSLSLI